MITLNVEQGSPQWIRARLGIPTASNFNKIITPKTMKLSSQAEDYAHQLIAEQHLGRPVEEFSTAWTIRGSQVEKEAVAFYELYRGVDTAPAPFCLRDDRRDGATPDRFVGTDGLLEIKVPNPALHIGYLLSEGIDYRYQTQGQLYITGRKWIDTLSYNSEMPSGVHRELRDEEFIAKLHGCIQQFLGILDDCKARLIHLYPGNFKNLDVPQLRVVA